MNCNDQWQRNWGAICRRFWSKFRLQTLWICRKELSKSWLERSILIYLFRNEKEKSLFEVSRNEKMNQVKVFDSRICCHKRSVIKARIHLKAIFYFYQAGVSCWFSKMVYTQKITWKTPERLSIEWSKWAKTFRELRKISFFNISIGLSRVLGDLREKVSR